MGAGGVGNGVGVGVGRGYGLGAGRWYDEGQRGPSGPPRIVANLPILSLKKLSPKSEKAELEPLGASLFHASSMPMEPKS